MFDGAVDGGDRLSSGSTFPCPRATTLVMSHHVITLEGKRIVVDVVLVVSSLLLFGHNLPRLLWPRPVGRRAAARNRSLPRLPRLYRAKLFLVLLLQLGRVAIVDAFVAERVVGVELDEDALGGIELIDGRETLVARHQVIGLGEVAKALLGRILQHFVRRLSNQPTKFLERERILFQIALWYEDAAEALLLRHHVYIAHLVDVELVILLFIAPQRVIQIARVRGASLQLEQFVAVINIIAHLFDFLLER